MRQYILTLLSAAFICILFLNGSCNKPPYKPDYSNIKGYVIGKETCNIDETQDYWLIDFTVLANPPKVGDTIIFNGITHTNVLKTKQLGQGLKQIGMRVSIDYKIITASQVITSGCNISMPLTYSLKEIFIINQFEIR